MEKLDNIETNTDINTNIDCGTKLEVQDTEKIQNENVDINIKDSISIETTTKDEDKVDFEFQAISDVSAFPSIFNKETMKLLEKWGLTHMELIKFRFNLAFNPILIEKFLKDLFNSPNVRNNSQGINNSIIKANANLVDKVKFETLTTNSVNLDLLDVVYENKLVNKETGYIRKDFEEFYEEISLSDKLKSALVNPEDENYSIFDERTRKEFLFRIFQQITVGGALNQYEDYAGEYFNTTKKFYKDLVNASKNPDTNEISIRNKVYSVLELNGKDIFKNKFNPQNFIYLIVDPYQKTVVVWFNKWENFW